MATRALQETLKQLQRLSGQYGEVLVAYSGGKDSLVTTDLCCRMFPRVKLFHFYLVPGLSLTENALEYARRRWGVEVVQYPSHSRFYNLRRAIYCPWKPSYLDLPEPSRREMYEAVRQDQGFALMATGERESEYRTRRLKLRMGGEAHTVYPIKGWNKYDILAYLAANKIPVPDSFREAGAVNLTTRSLLWVADNYPDDFEKICQAYPFARAVVLRREWYGVGNEED